MALVPNGMANPDVALFESNNPLIVDNRAVDDTEIPDGDCLEYSLFTGVAGPAGGEGSPSWWIELTLYIHVEDPGSEFNNIGIIIAPSTGGPDGASVPQPVLNPDTMRWMISQFYPDQFLQGSGPGSAYEVNMGSTTITPNPTTPYSLYITRFPIDGDTATYSLRTILSNRKDIS